MINRSKVAAAKARSQPLGSVAKIAGTIKRMADIARKPMGGTGGIGGGKPLAGKPSNPGQGKQLDRKQLEALGRTLRGRGTSLPPQNVFPSPKKTSSKAAFENSIRGLEAVRGLGRSLKQPGKLPFMSDVIRGGKPGTIPQGFRPGVTPPPRAMASQKPMLKKGGAVKKTAAKGKK